MLRTVLFDLDDTLFDHRHSSRAALSFLQQQYSPEIGGVSLDELASASLEILNSVHLEVLAGTISQEEARTKRFGMLFGKYGFTPPADRSQEIAALYRSNYQASRRATHGARSLLQSLRSRGIKTAIVSNNLVAEQMDKLQHCELLELLDSTTISEEAGYAKPDARIFHMALERLNCKPEEAIMIGDSWENDLLGAREAGIAGIWYNCYSVKPPEKSVPEIRSLKDADRMLRLLFPE